MRTLLFSGATLAAAFVVSSAIQSQTPPAPQFQPVSSVAFNTTGPVIRAHTEALKPFTVAGERGVVLGQQDGTFEAWVLPVKVLSHLTIEANIEGYTVPIDVNQQSAEIEVRPDRTVITYSHIGFTVRQIMFSPNQPIAGASAETGPVVLFQFDCLHPTDFTFRFTPELRWMWPERSEGTPGVEWVAGPALRPGDSRSENDKSNLASSGFYILHADYPDLAAAISMPGARPGILAPYQERPQVHPVELKLHIDPVRDQGRLYPLLLAVGTSASTANTAALGSTLEKLNAGIASSYAAHAESYRKLLDQSVSIETPDKSLNEAFQWAVVSIEQLKAKPWMPQPVGRGFIPGNTGTETAGASAPEVSSSGSSLGAETGLVAGYYASGDSARPGFGWFFGRDALYTLYAVHSYGDFALAKSELEFLLHRQREDGKIMHEYSQTAGAIDWRAFPYMYAAADATPLFLLATLDYVRSSGDTAFLTTHRAEIEKAWAFETGHGGKNGIYTNEQGTGWVESWPGGMPHQEVYLALLDQQASAAMAHVYRLLGDNQKAVAAARRAEDTAHTINEQFYDAEKGCYAFSRNADGSLDRTTTVYPALAWWSRLPGTASPNGANSILQHPDGCLRQLASSSLNTDWGLRDVSNQEKIYDGMSYHQGSVWPLFTGWAALAEYRGGQPLAGYQMLMENANLTKAQDLGAVTELLSGDFNVPFGRSTSHQLWSSAMVITPTLRGLFGIDIDATTKTITVNPHLPAGWTSATVRNVAVGDTRVDLRFVRSGATVSVELAGPGAGSIKLAGSAPTKGKTSSSRLEFAEAAVAVGDSIVPPLPGARTEAARILSQTTGDRSLTLSIEGRGGSTATFPIYRNEPKGKLAATGAELTAFTDSKPGTILVHFPEGEGWKTVTVNLTW